MLIKNWNYEQESKAKFHKEGKKMLRAINKELGLNADIRSNKAGSASLGEVTLHADNVYVQIGGLYPDQALIRSCEGKKDYCGGQNMYSGTDKQDIINHIKHYIL